MRSLAARHPAYLWERNVGYSTGAHLSGLAANGVTAHHRRSFLPVSQLTLGLGLPAILPPDEDAWEVLDLPVEPPGEPELPPS